MESTPDNFGLVKSNQIAGLGETECCPSASVVYVDKVDCIVVAGGYNSSGGVGRDRRDVWRFDLLKLEWQKETSL